jgi:hypothetical protein
MDVFTDAIRSWTDPITFGGHVVYA